jgi:TonB-linked SusC/RagA family outer membrane protein
MRQNYAVPIVLLLSLVLSAQTWAQSISGTVVDENNEPLPGVAVVVQGTGKGMATDFDGNYTITGLTPGDVTVEFSFIGYQKATRTVTVKDGANTTLNVKMEVESNQLDEVVVVGYGVQRKRDMTGSVVSLKSKELNDIPAPSFNNAIQGKASGVQVITGSGVAGSGSMVRVRGVASISAGGDPLYVVDGIPITQDNFLDGNRGGFNTNPLAAINPADIESIEILKDAAATGIYGSRGSNGVILITTKRGKRNSGLNITFSSRVGLTQPTALPNMMNTDQYLQMYEEAWVNDGNVGAPSGLPGNIAWDDAANNNTNWVDETIRTGVKQKYDLGITKGGENFNLYGALSYQDDQSYLRGNSYSRLAGRINLDYNIARNLKLGVSTSLSEGKNNRIDAAWSGGLGAAMSTALPIFPVRDSTGNYWIDAGINNNPVAARENRDWVAREFRSINNLSLEYRPIDNLVLRLQGSYDYMDFRDERYEGPIFDPSNVQDGVLYGKAFLKPFFVNNVNGYFTGSYLYDLNENNSFNFLLGTEYQYSNRRDLPEFQNTRASGTISETGESLTNAQDIRATVFETAFQSFFGRVNYSFKNKYLFEALARIDGSSRFGQNYKFGFFPAVSAGWIITEDLFTGVEAVNFLKLKTSYGRNGNSNLPDNVWYGQYEIRGNGYNNNDYRYPVRRANPNLRWETSNTFDVALEYGLWQDRITGEIAYYYKTTNDMLLDVTLQNATGYGSWWDNVGSVYNTGVEFAIKSRNIVGNNFTWTTDFNIARNYNEITSIGPYTEDAVSGGTNDTRVVVGSPIGTNFLVKFSHVDPATGRPVYFDINGNQTFTWDPIDRVAVGSVLPDAIGGLDNNFTFKNWDFGFLFVFTIGGDIYDSSSKRQLGVVTDWNMRTDLFDRWRQPGDQATYPRLTRETQTYGSGTPWINTDQWLHDGTYVRLRNVRVGYNMPSDLMKKWGLQSMRISFIATNLLTFTNYIGLDPEIARDFENATDRNMSPNITYLTPPQERTYNLGIDISF